MTTTTGGAARVMAWLERWLQTEWPHLEVYLTSVTDHWATASVAGPRSRDVVQRGVRRHRLLARRRFRSWRAARARSPACRRA